MTPGLPVLDIACATAGREAAEMIGGDGVTFFADLSGVLYRDGLYMIFVYLNSRSMKADTVAQQCGPLMFLFYGLLKSGLPWLEWPDYQDQALLLGGISSVFAGQLQALIQAKAVVERCLDYASAHAKSY